MTRTTDILDSSAATKIIREEISAAWPGIELEEQTLSENSKGVVLAGRFEQSAVVVKASISREWQSYLENERDCYQLFRSRPPALKVPKFIDFRDDPCFLMLERLPGKSLASNRYVQADDVFNLSSVLNALSGLRVYMSIRKASAQEIEGRYRERFDRYTKLGFLLPADREFLDSTLSLGLASEFNHGDPTLTNIIAMKSGPFFIDWEFGAWYLPLYDLAVLATISVNVPELQESILRAVDPYEAALRKAFLVNCLSVVSRELRTHQALVESVPIRDTIAALKEWMRRIRELIRNSA